MYKLVQADGHFAQEADKLRGVNLPLPEQLRTGLALLATTELGYQ